MTQAFAHISSDIMQKYQSVAPERVIKAVQKAAAKTGVDFTFLMEKAATESSFDAKATAKSSSATGLYQFIEQTWLTMVKNHGDKYGLGAYADKITLKDGKACVTDCAAKKEILDLRKNPEISALMAGEFSAENKNYLENHTRDDVGGTELYLAHFMGAGGAAKFLNSRACNPDACAAEIFPKAARANKSIFFDKTTGQPRTLDQIYALFDKKFSGGNPVSPNTVASPPLPQQADTVSAPASRATPPLTPLDVAGTLPSFDDDNEADDIIWNDDRRFFPQHPKLPPARLSPVSIMAMAEMTQTLSSLGTPRDRDGYNS